MMIEEQIKHLSIALSIHSKAIERHEAALDKAEACIWRDHMPQAKKAKVSSKRAKASIDREIPLRDGIANRILWLLGQMETQ